VFHYVKLYKALLIHSIQQVSYICNIHKTSMKRLYQALGLDTSLYKN